MKILVVGGTGPIGATIALHLKSHGHDITISSRHAPSPKGPLTDLNWVAGNYLHETFKADDLEDFEAIIFAAGSDIRHVPEGEDEDRHYLHANGVMVPKFAALAKAAGVKTFIHIGSFYPHVLPDIIDTNAYVRSRHLASQGVAELSSPTFRAMSLDAPFVVGVPGGMKNDMFSAYFSYARGWHPHVAPFGPAGGTNFVSADAVAQAVQGALENGDGGSRYLLGDENLSFADFFGYFFKAVGQDIAVPSIDKEHPFLPDVAIIQGRGNDIHYQPDEGDVKTLGYARNDVYRAIKSMLDDFDVQVGEVEPVKLGADAIFNPTLFALACQYGQAVDQNDPDLLEAICSPDIIVKGPGFINEGLEEVRAIPGLLQLYFDKTRHIVTQQLVTIDGDRAHGQTHCSAEHLLHSELGASERQILKWAVRYQDHFIRHNGSWVFERRELIVDWVELTPARLPMGTQ